MKKIFVVTFAVVFLAFSTSFTQAEDLSPALCKAKATAAAALLGAEGDAALAKIKDASGEFRFANGKGYVWVHDLDGIMVMHPIKPALDGRALLDMRDVNDVYLFVAMNEVVEDNGAGWVPYSWPKPGVQESSSKVSYVVLVKHGDKEYVAGSGMYDVTYDDIKKLFPSDPIYQND